MRALRLTETGAAEMVGERGDEMGEMNNIPLLMGMEAQTHSIHSTPMILIFVDTNMDTHMALSASPSETIDDLREKNQERAFVMLPSSWRKLMLVL